MSHQTNKQNTAFHFVSRVNISRAHSNASHSTSCANFYSLQ